MVIPVADTALITIAGAIVFILSTFKGVQDICLITDTVSGKIISVVVPALTPEVLPHCLNSGEELLPVI